jgi:hypothetical protein
VRTKLRRKRCELSSTIMMLLARGPELSRGFGHKFYTWNFPSSGFSSAFRVRQARKSRTFLPFRPHFSQQTACHLPSNLTFPALLVAATSSHNFEN